MSVKATHEEQVVEVWAGSRSERKLSIFVPAGILLVAVLIPPLILFLPFYFVIGRIFWGRVTVSGDQLTILERRVLTTRSQVARIRRIVPFWRRHHHRVPDWQRIELKESEEIEGLLFECERGRDGILVHSGVVSNRRPARRTRISEESLKELVEQLESRLVDPSEDGRRRWLGAHESEPDFRGIRWQRLVFTRDGIVSWYIMAIVISIKIAVFLCIALF